MRISAIEGLKVGILGFGREGQAAVRLLERALHTPPAGIITDSPGELPDTPNLIPAADAPAVLPGLDLLIRSPGFAPAHPVRREADRLGLRQTTLTNIFIREVRDAGIPLIGITGSKGKSTTATLTQKMLEKAGVASVLVGNIGNAATDALDDILARRAIPVMEMSSFQCADLEPGYGASSGAILDLFPDHLDWHGSQDHYFQSKFSLVATQRPEDTLVINAAALPYYQGKPIPAGHVEIINEPGYLHFRDGAFRNGDKVLLADSEMRIPGAHNRRNALSAFALARGHGVTLDHFASVLATFPGLKYRLQAEGCFHGVHWINDAISTTPDSTMAALDCFELAGASVIIGGQDRGVNLQRLAERLCRSDIRSVILVPDTGLLLAPLLEAGGAGAKVFRAGGLEEAVNLARAHTAAGAHCIFSPGAASFNAYQSFEQRGEHFTRLVRDPA